MRRVSIASASTAISLVVAELILRSVVGLPTCDQSLHATFTQTIAGLQPEVHYSRNALGLRESELSLGDAPVLVKILCLGASTTDQATQNWADTWCGELESRLNEKLRARGVAIRAAAYGRGAMTAADAADELERLLPRVRPDVVITLLGVNDMTWLRPAPGDHSTPRSQPDQACNESGSSIDPCPGFLYLCRAWRAVRSADRTTRAPHTVEWSSEHLPVVRERFRNLPLAPELPPSAIARRWFSRQVSRLVSVAIRANVPVVLLGQPVLWRASMSPEEADSLWFPVRAEAGHVVRVAPEALQREMSALNAIQLSIATRRRGVSFLDLEGRIPKDLKHFFDDCHFTDLGSHRVASIVSPALQRLVECAVASSARRRDCAESASLALRNRLVPTNQILAD